MSALASRSALYLIVPFSTALISLTILPLTTRFIGVEEYGALGIAQAIAGLVMALSASSVGYVLPEHLLETAGKSRKQLITASVLASGVTACIAATVLFLISFQVITWWFPEQNFLIDDIFICLVSACPVSVWTMYVTVLTLEGRAMLFALVAVCQAVANAGGILIALYVFGWFEHGLYVGVVCQALVALVGIILPLRQDVLWPDDLHWYRQMRKTAFAVGRTSLIEAGRTFFERSWLSMWVGIGSVSLYTHAQLYFNWAMMGVNVISRATWPIYVQEAKQDPPVFSITRKTWVLVQVCLTLLICGFALFGHEFINTISNNKFGDASDFVFVLLCALLVQTLGKSHMAYLIARGRGDFFSNATFLSNLFGVLLLLVLVPEFGALAVACSLALQYLALRLFILFGAKLSHRLPFQDHWVIGGIALGLAVYGWVAWANPDFFLRVMVMGVICVVIGGLSWRNFHFYLTHKITKKGSLPIE